MEQGNIVKIEEYTPKFDLTNPEIRALLYSEMISDLLDEIRVVDPENQTAKDVQKAMMMTPEFWEL